MTSDTLPELRGIHHIKFPVSDLDRSLAFYERVLGAKRIPAFDHKNEDGSIYAFICDVPGLGTKLELRLNPEHAEVRVLEHDERVAAAKLHRRLLGDLASLGSDSGSGAIAAGERDPLNTRVRYDRAACSLLRRRLVNTPAGAPASAKTFAIASAHCGIPPACFRMMTFPVARFGPATRTTW